MTSLLVLSFFPLLLPPLEDELQNCILGASRCVDNASRQDTLKSHAQIKSCSLFLKCYPNGYYIFVAGTIDFAKNS